MSSDWWYHTTGWTPCTEHCAHRGPYRVEYEDGAETAPFFVGPNGADVHYAITTAPSPVRVTAPHFASPTELHPAEDLTPVDQPLQHTYRDEDFA
jgi:hypothetical protein